MKNFLLLLLFSLAIAIGSGTSCLSQTDSVKTTSAQTQTAQTVQNASTSHCYLSVKPFTHWETWVIIAFFLIIPALLSVSGWSAPDYVGAAGCLMVVIAGVGFILAAIIAAAVYESFIMGIIFCGACIVGVGIIGQAIAGHRNK